MSAAWRAGFCPSPALDDVAHDAFVDGGGIDAGAADRLAHGDGAELGGGEVFQGTEELAGRRARRGNDNRLTH